MATHSSVLAWRIPGMEEPGGLPSMGSQRVRHDWSDLVAAASEKAMATHSSTLAWKIPWMEETGRLQSMGSLSWTRLSDFTFTLHFHALEKEMATHSSVLTWRIPGMGEPGGLPSMESHRFRHGWSDLAAAYIIMSSVHKDSCFYFSIFIPLFPFLITLDFLYEEQWWEGTFLPCSWC